MSVWLDKLHEHGDDQIITMVLGNKQDKEEERVISETEGANFAKDNNAAFFEVSAETGYNVADAVNTLVNEIASIIPKPSEISRSTIKNKSEPATSGCSN